MRVLVTGAAGFIGQPVVRALLAGGHEVWALDDFSVGSRELLEANDGVRVVEADLRDARETADAVAQAAPEGVIHLAAIHFIPLCVAEPAKALAVNVSGTQHLLDVLAGTPAKRLVFASTGDVYEPATAALSEDASVAPNNVYGASKLMGELLLRFHAAREEGFVAVAARLFNAFGPGETNPHVLPDILGNMHSSDVLRLGNTTPQRDYTYVDDIASALAGLLVGASESTTVNVGAGERTSVADLVALMAELTGRSLRIETDPAKVRASDRPVLQADNRRLLEMLPEVRFRDTREGLRETLRAEGLLAGSAHGDPG